MADRLNTMNMHASNVGVQINYQTELGRSPALFVQFYLDTTFEMAGVEFEPVKLDNGRFILRTKNRRVSIGEYNESVMVEPIRIEDWFEVKYIDNNLTAYCMYPRPVMVVYGDDQLIFNLQFAMMFRNTEQEDTIMAYLNMCKDHINKEQKEQAEAENIFKSIKDELYKLRDILNI